MGLYRRALIGAEAGLLAGASVVALFLVQDSFQLAPLATPAALANGFVDPTGYTYDTGLLATATGVIGWGVLLAAYTLTHFTTFALVGVAAAFLFRGLTWGKALLGGALYGATVCTGVFYGGRCLMDAPVTLAEVGGPSIVVANLVAGVVLGVGLYLGFSPGSADEAPVDEALAA